MHAGADPAGGAAGANLQRDGTVAEQRHAVKDFFPISSCAPPRKNCGAPAAAAIFILRSS